MFLRPSSASSSSSSSSVDDEEAEEGEDERANEKEASQAADTEYGSMAAGRLAFSYDLTKLDGDGKPRKKVARRLSRNESEKMRRDRLNAYIAELARLVPLIFSSSRKLDKASILRLTVTYLRIYHDLIKHSRSGMKWKPDFLGYENLENTLLQSLNGFLLVVNQSGQLIFTTEAFTSILGHSLVDVLGVSVYRLVHPDDKDILMQQFKGYQQTDSTCCETDSISHRSFYLRMAAKTNKPSLQYENVHIIGHVKVIAPVHHSMDVAAACAEPQLCLVGVGRVVSNETIYELSPLPDNNRQWVTQHEMDGTITFSDQRGSWLTGFMPGECVGMPAYALVHPEDVSPIVAVHNLMLSTGSVPVTVFRMLTKSKDILYIRNSTHIVVDMWTSKPKYIISVNEVIEEEHGKYLLDEQHKIFKALPVNSDSGAPSSVSSDSADDEKSCSNEMKHTHEENIILPDIIPEQSGNVSVIVGSQKFEILLADSEIHIDPNRNGKTGHSPPVFDPDVHRHSGVRGTSFVKPVFLGAENDQTAARSVYDDVNAYLGNDPRTIALGIDQADAGPSNCSVSASALSGLHAMAENCWPSFGRPERQLSSQWNGLRLPESCAGQQNPSHDSSRIPSKCPTLTSSHISHCHQSTSSPRCHISHQSHANSHVITSGCMTKHQNIVHVPSTDAQHNRRLVQLLNNRTALESRVRETCTSYLIRDSSGLVGDRGSDLGDINSRVLPLLLAADQFGQTGSGTVLKNLQHTSDFLNNEHLNHLELLMPSQAQQQQQQQQEQLQPVQQQHFAETYSVREKLLLKKIRQLNLRKQVMEKMLAHQRGQLNRRRLRSQQNASVPLTDSTTYTKESTADSGNCSNDLSQSVVMEKLYKAEEQLHAHERDLNLLRAEYMRKLQLVHPKKMVTSSENHVDNTQQLQECVDLEGLSKRDLRGDMISSLSTDMVASCGLSDHVITAVNELEIISSRSLCQDYCMKDVRFSGRCLSKCRSSVDLSVVVSLQSSGHQVGGGSNDPCRSASAAHASSVNTIASSEHSADVAEHLSSPHDGIRCSESTIASECQSSLCDLMYQCVTSTFRDDLDASTPPESSKLNSAAKAPPSTWQRAQPPNHEAALNAFLKQIMPNNRIAENNMSSGSETTLWIRRLLSDPDVVSNLLDEYVAARLPSKDIRD